MADGNDLPPVRLAIVNSLGVWGGGEAWVIQTALGLRQRGHAVLLLCHPAGPLRRRAEAAGLATRPVRIRHDLSLAAAARIAMSLRQWRPDVLLCCNERSMRVAAPAARLATRARIVFRSGLIGSFKNRRYNRWLVRWAMDRFVVNAAALREELVRYGWVPPERVRVIYNGMDLAPYRDRALHAARCALRREWGVPPEGVVAAMVGRLVPEKGFRLAMPAIAAARARCPQLHVVIAGEGPEREPLAEEIAARGLRAAVRLLGNRDDIPRVLAAADLLLHPSEREGAPNVVLEAMAAGRPVVATACAGTPELVVEGETGYLVPIADERALTERLLRLAEDGDLRRRMGAAGAARVAHCFSLDAALSAWECLFAELVAS